MTHPFGVSHNGMHSLLHNQSKLSCILDMSNVMNDVGLHSPTRARRARVFRTQAIQSKFQKYKLILVRLISTCAFEEK